ncbi:MAG: hypothetical protein KatS3mg110_1630 [Pirellulaceae bacterium]|nr:MAG: hypothetical protein KatS3mg110_1630 [Pirellulaceae bacterium]
MVGPKAEVRSVEALVQFRQALVGFGQEVAGAADLVEAELHRVRQWIEVEQVQYWKHAVDEAEQRLAEARVELERAETTSRPEDRPSCHVQRKLYELAKRRLSYCEHQLRVVKHWRGLLEREMHNLAGRIGKLRDVADIDVARAVATLDRHIQALRDYLATSGPATSAPASPLPPPDSASRLPPLGPPRVSEPDSMPDPRTPLSDNASHEKR